MTRRAAEIICGHPIVALCFWVAATASVCVLAPSRDRIAMSEPTALLPADEPSQVALAVERQAFPEISARSRTVIILERRAGLTPADLAYVGRLTGRLATRRARQDGWRILSPIAQPFLRSRLISSDGQAAMIVVNMNTHWVTTAGKLDVERIEAIAREERLPDGLSHWSAGWRSYRRAIVV